jgi:hypothetical protein
VEIAGKPMRVKVAHLRLCASCAVYVRAYPRETQEMVFDAQPSTPRACRDAIPSKPYSVPSPPDRSMQGVGNNAETALCETQAARFMSLF